jgi:hypothetical protein
MKSDGGLGELDVVYEVEGVGVSFIYADQMSGLGEGDGVYVNPSRRSENREFADLFRIEERLGRRERALGLEGGVWSMAIP